MVNCHKLYMSKTLKLNSLQAVVPIVMVAMYVVYIIYGFKKNRNEIFIHAINSKIKHFNSSSTGREKEYQLENGLKLYVGVYNDTLLNIGDSISKEANSLDYRIYRKDLRGVYIFWKKVNFNETL